MHKSASLGRCIKYPKGMCLCLTITYGGGSLKKKSYLSEQQFIQFIEQKLAEGNIFELLKGFCHWIRCEEQREDQLKFLIKILKKNKTLTQNLASQLCRWLCSMRLYPLLISNGILSRDGFRREFRSRLYEKFNPSVPDVKDLRDIFFLLFNDKNDVGWLNSVPLHYWGSIFKLLNRYASEAERERVDAHLRAEGLFAIKMLSIWIAAEEMQPELMRLDPSLIEADSPFVALQKEVTQWIDARRRNELFDDGHLQVMFAQSKALIDRLKKKGAAMGSSMEVAYLLERLEQTLDRLAMLMEVFASNRFLPRRILLLTRNLAIASANKHSVSALWKQSVSMLSRSITQNTSDHGEHYITRNKSEYLSMFYSAAGGGVLIALMALFKIYLGSVIDDKVLKGIVEGLNYGIGFTLIFMLHLTVATKQPAMTAARFADFVGKNPQGRAVNMKLAQLLIDVFRSQSIAVIGNVAVAIGIASLVAYGYQYFEGKPLLVQAQIAYQLHSIDPLGETLWFAAIAGVWLFCAGLISGYIDNRCNYLNLRVRLQHHPLLVKIMSEHKRLVFANYMHNNYGSIVGNLTFGMLLGLTSVVGYLLNLPLDIRHIAFSSANVGYVVTSGNLSWVIFWQSIGFVLLIGVVNLAVSFSLTLSLALRSLGATVDSWKNIAKCIWQILKQKPLSLILPV